MELSISTDLVLSSEPEPGWSPELFSLRSVSLFSFMLPPLSVAAAVVARDGVLPSCWSIPSIKKSASASSVPSLSPFSLDRYSSSFEDIVGKKTLSPLVEIEIFKYSLDRTVFGPRRPLAVKYSMRNCSLNFFEFANLVREVDDKSLDTTADELWSSSKSSTVLSSSICE
uniref:C-169 protein n=1 Tax=Saccharomyces cerevisiae TaxID=4932 RepID=E9PA47_YEASX|nr:C-169 protein [Saccharomyces cerevisiae]